MKKIQSRMIIIFTLILLSFSILFVYMMSSVIERQAIDQQAEALNVQLVTLESQLESEMTTVENRDRLITQLASASEVINERITFIGLTGEVLYDSHASLDTIDNHLDRPEIEQIIEGQEIGTYYRISESTGDVLYYSAAPIRTDEGTLAGFIRLSKSAEEVIGVTDELMTTLLVFIVLSIFVAVLFIRYWAEKITAPIENIKNIANVLSFQDYSVRYRPGSYKEIDELGDSINNLAVNLYNQMGEIKENELKLKELVNHLVIGVMVVERDKTINMVNPIMNEILGEDLNSKQGKPFYESLHSSELIAIIEKAYDNHVVQNEEIQIYYPEEKIVDVHVVPISNESLETLNFIVLLYDITEIRRLEKVRTDFVANVSHELRTPITAVKGFSETLLDGALYDEDVLVEFLEIIYKESSRLDAMVNDILQLSKLEQRKVSGIKEKIRVKDTVDEVIKILSQKIDMKQIHININDSENVEIEMNPDHLKQMIINLVGNAVSYTPEKGKVTIDIDTLDDELKLSIIDSGIGIPKDQVSRIFERFYRVDKGRSRNVGGTGLGLSIVKWLVENNDGRIEVKSEVGKGTRFTVWLPLSSSKKSKKYI
ncbi:MAG: ATP-binding protein [Alkalibacterium sp.]|uniref:two-component system histidine kinase PnpS n=1 Tax=Alkalibacterium sp. TaxID=1872447 RepID=UPI0039707883